MPPCANVAIRYGPYESCGVTQHHKDRLQGMFVVLTEHGHTVHYEEVNEWNAVELWVNGEQIFTCDIRELDYGGDGRLDQLCSKALEAVENAF